jgi:hypothetical protein
MFGNYWSTFCLIWFSTYQSNINKLSFIDPERGGFGVIFPEVKIFSEGLRSDDIFRGALPRGKYHHWGKYYAESPERRVYKWYIIPKVKELTKFRINFKTCWILTTRIQFLLSYVYLSFWRFLFKIFEHVSFGSLKVTYVLKIFG